MVAMLARLTSKYSSLTQIIWSSPGMTSTERCLYYRSIHTLSTARLNCIQ